MDYKSLANFAAARKVAKEAPDNYRPADIANELEPQRRFDNLWNAIGTIGKIGGDSETGCIIQINATTETGAWVEVWLSRLNVKDEEDGSQSFRVIQSHCYDEDEIEIGPEEYVSEPDISTTGDTKQPALEPLASLEGSYEAVLALQARPDADLTLDYSPK